MDIVKALVAALMTCIAACAPTADGGKAQYDAKISYLCVGMETSRRFGECPGCAKDAKVMTSILSDKLGYSGTTLISEEATKSKVVSLLKEGVARTPADGMFIFTYSGHGGQEQLGGNEPDGADRADEYLCLYDTYLLDDALWEIVSRCKGRVFMYFDCCHSATMYRSVRSEIDEKLCTPAVLMLDEDGNPVPYRTSENLVKSKGFTFKVPKRRVVTVSRDGVSSEDGDGLRLLCWSGCKEDEYSYGSYFGGTLTSAVEKHWKKGIPYEKLWEDVSKSVRDEQPGQTPVKTNVGCRFEEHVGAFQ